MNLPPALRRALTALALLGVCIGLEFGFEFILPDVAWRQIVSFGLANVVVALSLNVINGMAGQFSIGHAGFVGVGAYTAALIAGKMHIALGGGEPTFGNSFVVMPVALLAGAAAAGVFGVVVGLPSLRLKGDYLAIVTLGFAEIFRLVLATADPAAVDAGGLKGALASLGGLSGYAGPDHTGVPQYAGPFWIFGGALVATIVAWRLKFSGWGRALRALREDEIASAAVGVDPTSYKVTSFVIAAVGAGFAGGLFATMRGGVPTVQPDQFTFVQSFDAITMVILGGSGSVSGAVVGGLFVTFTVKLIEQLQGLDSVIAFTREFPSFDLNAMRMVLYASVLIALMIWRPDGLFGERELFRRVRKTTLPPSSIGKKPPSEPANEAPPEEPGEGSERVTTPYREAHPAQSATPILELRHVSKTFGGLRAVGDVSFQVPAGSVFGLIGPNGAGKTTAFNLVTGVYKPDAGGTILFEGKDVGPLKPSEIARAGIARTFQNIRLFGQLTVLENVLVACENTRKAHLGAALLRLPLYYKDEEEMQGRALELLSIFDLESMADEISTSLSYGNQRRLEIARAMMLKPRLLLLDEPAAGMNYGEAEGLKKQIRWLREKFGITVILVEHNMQVVMGVCEEIHVLDHGETIAHGTPDEVKKHPKVLAAYLGEEEAEA